MPTRAALAVAVAALGTAACSGRGARTPSPADELPATTWSTELPPYRLPGRPVAMIVDDARAVFAIEPDRVAAIDLATGALTSRRTPGIKGDIAGIARDAHGGLSVAFVHDAKLAIYTVGTDLALALDHDSPDDGWDGAVIASAPDGQLALAAEHHRLVLFTADGSPGATPIYPPGTSDLGWDDLMFAAHGTLLLARYGGGLYAFDTKTGVPTRDDPIGSGTWVAASDGAHAIAEIDNVLTVMELATAIQHELARPSTRFAAVSPDGSLAARLDDSSVMINDLATRRVTARYALGASQGPTGLIGFTPRGDRVVIAAGLTVRVLDVATGTLTDPGPGPYASPTFLAMTRTQVISGADRLRRWSVTGGAPEVLGPDGLELTDGALAPDASRYVTAHALPKASDDAPTVLAVETWPIAATADTAPTASWTRDDSIASIAIDGDGVITVGAWHTSTEAVPGHNVIERGETPGAWHRLLEVHYDGYVDAIDAQTQLAVVSSGGAVRVVQLPGAAPVAALDIPSCDSGGAVHLDATGKRVATDDDKTLWLWSFADGPATVIGAAQFAGKVGDVVFVPGSPEVAIDLDDRIGLWNYATGAIVAQPIDGVVTRLAVDPGGLRVAAALSSGRLLVFALAELRAAPAEPTTDGAPQSHCPRDPLEPPGDRRPSTPPPFTPGTP